MREIRLYGSEGGGAVRSPYPYLSGCVSREVGSSRSSVDRGSLELLMLLQELPFQRGRKELMLCHVDPLTKKAYSFQLEEPPLEQRSIAN